MALVGFKHDSNIVSNYCAGLEGRNDVEFVTTKVFIGYFGVKKWEDCQFYVRLSTHGEMTELFAYKPNIKETVALVEYVQVDPNSLETTGYVARNSSLLHINHRTREMMIIDQGLPMDVYEAMQDWTDYVNGGLAFFRQGDPNQDTYMLLDPWNMYGLCPINGGGILLAALQVKSFMQVGTFFRDIPSLQFMMEFGQQVGDCFQPIPPHILLPRIQAYHMDETKRGRTRDYLSFFYPLHEQELEGNGRPDYSYRFDAEEFHQRKLAVHVYDGPAPNINMGEHTFRRFFRCVEKALSSDVTTHRRHIAIPPEINRHYNPQVLNSYMSRNAYNLFYLLQGNQNPPLFDLHDDYDMNNNNLLD